MGDNDRVQWRDKAVALFASVLLVVFSSLILVADTPRVWAPMPFPFVLILLMFGRLGLPALLSPMAGFLLFRPWDREQVRIPRRSVALFLVLGALTLWHFLGSRSGAVLYQGYSHTVTVLIGNIAFVTVLSGLALLSHIKPTSRVSFMFHWLLFLWLGWYAFPYLGESL